MAYKIYLSPSDQNRNYYAYGDTTENVQCCRIADSCEIALKRCGFDVKNNQYDGMIERVEESNAWSADLHIPIHTNAFNGEVSGTRMFYLNETSKGKDACLSIFKRLAPITPGTSESIKTYPSLYELKATTAVAAYIEVDFHDVPSVAKWIIEHPAEIGEAICHGVCDYFDVPYVSDEPLDSGDGSEWSKDDREWAVRNGIFKGYDSGNFRWKDPITREETAAVLHRLSTK